MDKKVVAVTLNYNQNDYSVKCVESLLESNYPNLEVLLVDNGSTPENSKSLVSALPKDDRLHVHLIEENIGYAQGTNNGLAEGLKLNPDFFLILNNDTIIDKNAVKELVSTGLEFGEKALITGKVYDYVEPNRLQLVGYKYREKRYNTFIKLGLNEIDEGQFEEVEERDMIDDIFVLQPVELFKKEKGYSNYFWLNGVNVDLAFRAKNLGYKLIYTPNAKLWHKGSASIGGRDKNPKLAYWHIQASLILRYLYLDRFNFCIFYLKTWDSAMRTYFRSLYNRMTGKRDLKDYSRAKFAGLRYFNKWVWNKTPNDGYNPF